MTNDDVIENPDIQQGQGGTQPLGDTPVGCAGFGHTRGVVVGEYQGGSPVLQCPHGDLPRIHGGAIQRAKKQILAAEHPVLAVEEQAGKNLPVPGAQMQLQEASGLAATADHLRIRDILQGLPTRQLQGGTQTGILRRSDAGRS